MSDEDYTKMARQLALLLLPGDKKRQELLVGWVGALIRAVRTDTMLWAASRELREREAAEIPADALSERRSGENRDDCWP